MDHFDVLKKSCFGDGLFLEYTPDQNIPEVGEFFIIGTIMLQAMRHIKLTDSGKIRVAVKLVGRT